MKASTIIRENTQEILKNKNFNVILNVTYDTGKTLARMLEQTKKLDDTALDWICNTLPYYPSKFLRKDAVYYIDIDEKQKEAVLWFPVIMFTPSNILETFDKIDMVSGGYSLVKPSPKENGLIELGEEE
jgi:hypothetical protein